MVASVFLCLGHALLDSRCYMNEFPKSDGMTILLKPIQNSCGGSAANVAFNLARMGIRSRLCAAVGDGNVSKMIINQLSDHGVDTSGIRRNKGDTGKAVVLIDSHGNVKVFESIETSDNYFVPKIKDFNSVCHLHMTGTNFKLLLSYSKMASTLGVPISFDPGRGKVKLGLQKLSPILKRTTILFLNRNELSLLMQKECFSVEQVMAACRELYNMFNLFPVIKAGGKETVCYDGKRFVVRKPRKVRVIDTIGAGDAFDSGFIACYFATKSISKAVDFGMKIASLKVQKLGAQALPPKKVVRALYKKASS